VCEFSCNLVCVICKVKPRFTGDVGCTCTFRVVIQKARRIGQQAVVETRDNKVRDWIRVMQEKNKYRFGKFLDITQTPPPGYPPQVAFWFLFVMYGSIDGATGMPPHHHHHHHTHTPPHENCNMFIAFSRATTLQE
jgi:hypothetical protein